MLTLIGLGLHDELGICLGGLENARNSDFLFAEFYTSYMPGLSLNSLEKLIGKPIRVLSRTDVEEKAEEKILKLAEGNRVALLVPGDPMTATTHVDLRLRAAKRGIKTVLIHGVSAISAVISATGLQNYKFGKTVTMPIIQSGPPIETPYEVIKENSDRGLHTLVLLDINVDLGRCLLIGEALKQLQAIEQKRCSQVAHEDRLVVGVARVGAEDAAIKGGCVRDMINYEFGGPPHSLIFPGRLHFMEVETLQVFAKTERRILEANI
jgi:diphthine synthase